MNSTWLSTYLYCYEPFEPFLKKAVKPFIVKLFEKKIIDQYFFIRYWEKGSHIRLRLKGDDITLEQEVKPYLIKWFNKKGLLINKSKELSYNHDDWYPINTILFVPYEREIERYGGPHAIEIAEKLFHASSETILNVISKSKDWNYEQALGTAIQMHLTLAACFHFTPAEIKYFFNYIYGTWFNNSIFNKYSMSLEEIDQQSKIVLNAFQNSFNKQKEYLVPYHQDFWAVLKNGGATLPKWVRTWSVVLNEINIQLTSVIEKGLFIEPSYYSHNSNALIDEKKQKIMHILESYVHMTNNRLGILNRDEAFLGYLIKQSMEQVNL